MPFYEHTTLYCGLVMFVLCSYCSYKRRLYSASVKSAADIYSFYYTFHCRGQTPSFKSMWTLTSRKEPTVCICRKHIVVIVIGLINCVFLLMSGWCSFLADKLLFPWPCSSNRPIVPFQLSWLVLTAGVWKCLGTACYRLSLKLKWMTV